jgi:hypothetical protein
MSPVRGRRRTLVFAAWFVSVGLVATAAIVYAQEQSVLYVFAVDEKGTPVLDLQPSDIAVKEEAGDNSIVSVRRFGWPLKVTVLVDNGTYTKDALVHYRSGLQKFFRGLPPDVPVSLIAMAPNPRWLIRDTKDKVQIEKNINLITPEGDDLPRFSDALIEYSRRLDEEFRNVSAEQLPPYLPVLVVMASTHQDGSSVIREQNLKMINSLRKHRAWTHMIMIAPPRPPAAPGEAPVVNPDEGQNAEIAKAVQEFTGGRYTPIGSSGTSALASKILPDLAQEITFRYIRQMMQHRIILQRPNGAAGPMKNFSLSLVNRKGVKALVSTNGNFP